MRNKMLVAVVLVAFLVLLPVCEARFSFTSLFKNIFRKKQEFPPQAGASEQEGRHYDSEDHNLSLHIYIKKLNRAENGRKIPFTIAVKNHGDDPVWINEFGGISGFAWRTLDLEVTTPDGKVLHYTGYYPGKCWSLVVVRISPHRTSRAFFEGFPEYFGEGDIGDFTRYNFTENPGVYKIKAYYRSYGRMFGAVPYLYYWLYEHGIIDDIWKGSLESEEKTFVILEEEDTENSKLTASTVSGSSEASEALPLSSKRRVLSIHRLFH